MTRTCGLPREPKPSVGSRAGRGLETRLVHFHVKVEKGRPPLLHHMLDQRRLPDLTGAKDNADLVAGGDLPQDCFRRSFEIHNVRFNRLY